MSTRVRTYLREDINKTSPVLALVSKKSKPLLAAYVCASSRGTWRKLSGSLGDPDVFPGVTFASSALSSDSDEDVAPGDEGEA